MCKRVEILDKYERIDFVSLTKADEEGLLDEIPAHKHYKSFHLISTDLKPLMMRIVAEVRPIRAPCKRVTPIY